MDYEYLSRAVGQVAAGWSGPASAATREVVPGWAIGVLREVADGGRPVRAVRHPLGFTCLPVERAGRDGVCVHVWSPRAGRAAAATSQVHAHCWELTSYVLFGRLENRIMRVAEAAGLHGGGALPARRDGEPGLYRVLDVRSGVAAEPEEAVDELVPTARLVHCVPGQRQLIGPGDVYSVPAGVFHATHVPAGTEAATVALGRLVPGAPDWALGPPGSEPRRDRRDQRDAGQTAEVARIVLGRLLTATPCPT